MDISTGMEISGELFSDAECEQLGEAASDAWDVYEESINVPRCQNCED